MKIRPKNWASFQHYKDGSTITWIKLHKKLLDDYEFQGMPVASRALAPMLWLIGSEHPEGIIDATPAKLAFRLRVPVSEISEALSPLIGKGFFEIVEFPPKGSIPRLGSVYTENSPDNINKRISTREENPLVPLARDGGDVRREKAERRDHALQLLEFLNGKARRHFRPVAANLKFIEARLGEGISLQDLKTLTVRKCREWLGTDQEKFLRPETLFNATKCHSYLGAISPEDQPCNVQAATEDSKRASSPATADGQLLIDQEAMPQMQH